MSCPSSHETLEILLHMFDIQEYSLAISKLARGDELGVLYPNPYVETKPTTPQSQRF